jgi:sulfatase maturation enzyme AslB (radical SAM superfamily)
MKDIFCVYPRFHLLIKPNGTLKPCCRFDAELSKNLSSTINTNPLSALDSNNWKKLRDEMDRNQTHPGCTRCIEEELIGVRSMRMDVPTLNNLWDIDASQVELQELEIAFGNLCNLACRSCNSNLSSQWFDDDKLISQYPEFRRKPSKQKNITASFDRFKPEELSNLKSVKFTGGEPLLHKEFWLFLKTLYDAGINDKVRIRICTNATFFPKSEHIELLKKFPTVQLGVSIDGYEKHNDYLRYPSKWAQVSHVMNQWADIVDNHQMNWLFVLSSTISAYSVEAYNDLYFWWREFASQHDSSRYRMLNQPVFEPSYLAPSILPDNMVRKFSGFQNTEVEKYFSGKEACEEKMQLFLKYTRLLDKVRDQKFSVIFPKLNSLINDAIQNSTKNC